MARKPLVTFEGWDGQWWRRIRVGRAVYTAVTTVYVPWKVSLLMGAAEAVTGFDLEEKLFGTVRGTGKARR